MPRPIPKPIPAFRLEVYGRDGALKPSPLGGATVGALPLCSMGVGLLVIYQGRERQGELGTARTARGETETHTLRISRGLAQQVRGKIAMRFN